MKEILRHILQQVTCHGLPTKMQRQREQDSRATFNLFLTRIIIPKVTCYNFTVRLHKQCYCTCT